MGRKGNEKATEQVETGALRKHLIALVLIGSAIFLAYVNSLNGTWALDDVVANKPVGIHDIQDLVGFRKVAYLTFHLNQLIAPFSPASFRLFNILIHILNTVLVYVLAYKTVLLMGIHAEAPADKAKDVSRKAAERMRRTERHAFYTALLSSAVFGLHPLNINAVAYIVQRMASLATLFVLLSLLCYISAANSKGFPRSIVWYTLSGVFLVAGVLSKENAVMGVPLILLYDLVFISHFRGRLFLAKVGIIVILAVAVIGFAYYFLNLQGVLSILEDFLLAPNEPLKQAGWMATDVYWTPLQHILTEFRVVARYIELVLFPLPRLFVFDWWGFPVSTGLTEPITTLFSLLLVMSLSIFSVLKMRRYPFLCFGILWYLCALSLESFLALGSDLYFEHRNYLPLSGLIIGVVGQIVLSVRKEMKESSVVAVAVVLSVVLGTLTFSRNFVWKDSLTLWEDTLRKDPANLRAIMAKGNAYMKLSDLTDAEKSFKQAIVTSAKEKRLQFLNDSVYSLGMLYLFNGEIQKAKALLERFENTLQSLRVLIFRGFYRMLTNDFTGAFDDFKRIVPRARGIDSVVIHTLMGDAYRRRGQLDEAIGEYRKALSVDPGFSTAHYGIGASYLAKRDLGRAREFFDKALSFDPNNVFALSDMADLMLIRKAGPEEALAYAERAVSKSPPFHQPYLTMANVLIVVGRDEAAEGYYQKALERGAPPYLVPFSKARAYYLRGNTERMNHYLSELQQYKDLPENLRGMVK